jgi:IMP cyclohydrolase
MKSVAVPRGIGTYAAHIVSNGDQTEDVASAFADGLNISSGEFADALSLRYCEPDAPTFTARITGYATPILKDSACLSVLRADPRAKEIWLKTIEEKGLKKDDFASAEEFNKAVGAACELNHREFPTLRSTFEVPLMKGYGHCITTYAPGSKTLPPFEGEPFIVPVKGPLEDVMASFWDALEPEWRVALGGKTFVTDEGYKMAEPINRHSRGGGE